MAKIVDFDKIIPDKRIAKIAGKEIDVSVIPARITLEVAKFRDGWLGMSSEELQQKSLEIVEKICKATDPDFDIEEVLDKTNFDQLAAFMDFVMEPLNRSREEDKGKKKVKSKKKK
jgi:hypothetical protein